MYLDIPTQLQQQAETREQVQSNAPQPNHRPCAPQPRRVLPHEPTPHPPQHHLHSPTTPDPSTRGQAMAQEEWVRLSPQHSRRTPKGATPKGGSAGSVGSLREVHSPADSMLQSEGPEAGDGDDDASVGSHGSFATATSETSLTLAGGDAYASASASALSPSSAAAASQQPGDVRIIVPVPYLDRVVLGRKLKAEIEREKQEEERRKAKAAKAAKVMVGVGIAVTRIQAGLSPPHRPRPHTFRAHLRPQPPLSPPSPAPHRIHSARSRARRSERLRSEGPDGRCVGRGEGAVSRQSTNLREASETGARLHCRAHLRETRLCPDSTQLRAGLRLKRWP